MAIDIDQHRHEYAADGFTVLRAAIPPELLSRLQAAAEELRVVTRAALGPGATRPPGGYVGGRVIADFADQIDTAAFKEWEDVPDVRAFVDGVLGTDYVNDHDAFTMLYEAEDREWVQGWHRDYRDNVPWLDKPAWYDLLADLRYFNQFNAALYHDISLWLVPGSHCREDTPEERAVVTHAAAKPPAWAAGETSPALYSQQADAYLRSIPGAHRVVLAPGDVAMYRDSAIHLGHYVPTIKRATLHGHFESDVSRKFFDSHFKNRPENGTAPKAPRYE